MLPLVVKSLHIIAVVSWFAMLFYLPRLFVYHSMTEDAAGRERFKIMERKLYRAIGTPAMVATIIFGAWMAHLYWSYYGSSTWFWIKAGLVICLIGYHHMCGAYVRKFAQDKPVPSHKFFRVFNEIPVLFLIAIVFLVVTKMPA
jgi:Predicted membrane protein